MLWTPPEVREPEELTQAVTVALRELGARVWQVRLTAPLVAAAVIEAEQPVPEEEQEPPATGSDSSSPRRWRGLGVEDRHGRRVDLLGDRDQVECGHREQQFLEIGRDRDSSSSQVSSSGGIAIRPAVSLKTVALRGCLVGCRKSSAKATSWLAGWR